MRRPTGESLQRLRIFLSNLPASAYIFIMFYVSIGILIAISFTVPRKYVVEWRWR